MDKIIKKDHTHVDNGGVTVSVVDNGEEILLSIAGQYYGYPGVESRINIEFMISVAENHQPRAGG